MDGKAISPMGNSSSIENDKWKDGLAGDRREGATARRQHGVSPATIGRWLTTYAGAKRPEIKRLKAQENAVLRRW